MTVRVRFAPSPTGYLHIGGARTALYNYLFAKATGGTYVLRIEDTDVERSTKEYEEMVMEDLKWLGLTHVEGPDCPGNCGPYRQSERTAIYKKHAEELVDRGLAFYCFCTQEELEAKKKLVEEANGDPRYDGTCHHITKEEARARIAKGEEAVIRFKAPEKEYVLQDKVRGTVTYPVGMVGDFVIIRSNGLPVYNYCCVVDDWLMSITHVIRAEDHLANTLRQLMLYEAFGVTPPVFAHVSLLVGHDRQKLSKRHGATSVHQYRKDGFLPQALNNYLCQLGWSHPEEKDIYSLDQLLEHFNLDRFNKAAATFDMAKLTWVNGQHLRLLSDDQILSMVQEVLPANHEFYQLDLPKQQQAIALYKEKCEFAKDYIAHLDDLFFPDYQMTDDLKEIFSWETTPAIKTYLLSQVGELLMQGQSYLTEDQFNFWSEHIKKELKIKGKPLFMGMRGVLTGKAHGSDLKITSMITPLKIFKNRLEK